MMSSPASSCALIARTVASSCASASHGSGMRQSSFAGRAAESDRRGSPGRSAIPVARKSRRAWLAEAWFPPFVVRAANSRPSCPLRASRTRRLGRRRRGGLGGRGVGPRAVLRRAPVRGPLHPRLAEGSAHALGVVVFDIYRRAWLLTPRFGDRSGVDRVEADRIDETRDRGLRLRIVA